MGRRRRFDQGRGPDALKPVRNSACARCTAWHRRPPSAPRPCKRDIEASPQLPFPGAGIKSDRIRDGSTEEKSVRRPDAALTAVMLTHARGHRGAAMAPGLYRHRTAGWPTQTRALRPYATDRFRRIARPRDPARRPSNGHHHSPTKFGKVREA